MRRVPTPLLWSNAACLAPVVALVAVLAATATFNARVGLGHVTVTAGELPVHDVLEVTPAGSDLPGVASQLLARLGWAVTGIALLVMILVALGGGTLLLVRCVRALGGRRRLQLLGVTMVLVAAVAAERHMGITGEWLVAEPEVFTDLRKATLYDECVVFDRGGGEMADGGVTDSEDPCADRGGQPPEDPEDLELAAEVENGMVHLAYLSFALLFAAASASLAVPDGHLAREERQRLVAERLRDLRWLLYLGAGVLVLHALEMYAFYRWPGAWLPAEQAELVERMAHGVSTANGAFFSLLLLALYLPAAGLMRLRGLELLDRDGPEKAPAQRREQARAQGLLASPLEELASLLVTLGPLLAGGPLAGVLEMLAL